MTGRENASAALCVADVVARRRALWERTHDLGKDRRFVREAAARILRSRSMREEILCRPYLLIEATFHIVDKEKATVPFFFNEVQREFLATFEERGTGRPYYVLKGRQQGFTSLITAMQLSYAIVRHNFSGMTLADSADNAMTVFNDKARVVYERLPEVLRPTERFSSKKELFFDRLNSSWRVSTASEHVGRSRTLNFVHFSEIAFYDCSLSELQKGIGEALTPDAVCVYETTANGWGDAKALWDSGVCHNLFFPWWKTAEYRCRDREALDRADAWLRERVAYLRGMGLDEEQICWYCRKYATYLDKSTIRQEYPCTAEEAFVFGGECVFDKEAIANRLIACRGEVPRRGYFAYRTVGDAVHARSGEVADVDWRITDIRFVEDAEGCITLHEAPRVRTDRESGALLRAPYAIGGDTAGSGADYFTAKVVCTLDGKTAATLRRRRMDEDLYAEQLYCLGKYYHDAIIGVETNYSHHPMRVLQRKYGYGQLYLRERIDRFGGEVERVCGFETTARTKPVIIAELVELMREDPTRESDPETLCEMMSFIRHADGRLAAAGAGHDDLVMALAIAHHVAGQGEHRWLRAEGEDEELLASHFSLPTRRSENETYMNWED